MNAFVDLKRHADNLRSDLDVHNADLLEVRRRIQHLQMELLEEGAVDIEQLKASHSSALEEEQRLVSMVKFCQGQIRATDLKSNDSLFASHSCLYRMVEEMKEHLHDQAKMLNALREDNKTLRQSVEMLANENVQLKERVSSMEELEVIEKAKQKAIADAAEKRRLEAEALERRRLEEEAAEKERRRVEALKRERQRAILSESLSILNASFVGCRVSSPQDVIFDSTRLSVTGTSSMRAAYWMSGCPLPQDRDSWWTTTRTAGGHVMIGLTGEKEGLVAVSCRHGSSYGWYGDVLCAGKYCPDANWCGEWKQGDTADFRYSPHRKQLAMYHHRSNKVSMEVPLTRVFIQLDLHYGGQVLFSACGGNDAISKL